MEADKTNFFGRWESGFNTNEANKTNFCGRWESDFNTNQISHLTAEILIFFRFVVVEKSHFIT